MDKGGAKALGFPFFLRTGSLDITLSICAQRRAQYSTEIPNFCTERNIPTKHQIYTTTPIASVCLCNWLPLLRDIMSIRRSICSLNRSTNTFKMIRKRSKSSKLRIFIKMILRYDRGGKRLDKNHDHRLINSKRNECSLKCITKLDGKEKNPKTDLSNLNSFDVFVDLFNEQIERRMLIISLSRGSQLHRHTEAIEMMV